MAKWFWAAALAGLAAWGLLAEAHPALPGAVKGFFDALT